MTWAWKLYTLGRKKSKMYLLHRQLTQVPLASLQEEKLNYICNQENKLVTDLCLSSLCLWVRSMQSCIHDERGKTGWMGKLREGCNLGSKHNPVLTCEKRISVWKALEKKEAWFSAWWSQASVTGIFTHLLKATHLDCWPWREFTGQTGPCPLTQRSHAGWPGNLDPLNSQSTAPAPASAASFNSLAFCE